MSGGVGRDGLTEVQCVGHVGDDVRTIHVTLLVGQRQGGVINTGEVAGAGGLAAVGLEGEGVQVDTGGHLGAGGLVGLHLVKVRPLARGETVLAVQLQLGGVQHGEGLVERGGVGEIGAVLGVAAAARVGKGGVLAVSRGDVEVPRQVLGRVVEIPYIPSLSGYLRLPARGTRLYLKHFRAVYAVMKYPLLCSR